MHGALWSQPAEPLLLPGAAGDRGGVSAEPWRTSKPRLRERHSKQKEQPEPKQGGTLSSRGPHWLVISLKPTQHTQEPGAERWPSPSSLWGAFQGCQRALPQVLIV